MGNGSGHDPRRQIGPQPADANRYRLKGSITLTANYAKKRPRLSAPAVAKPSLSGPNRRRAGHQAGGPARSGCRPPVRQPALPRPAPAGPAAEAKKNPLTSPSPGAKPGPGQKSRQITMHLKISCLVLSLACRWRRGERSIRSKSRRRLAGRAGSSAAAQSAGHAPFATCPRSPRRRRHQCPQYRPAPRPLPGAQAGPPGIPDFPQNCARDSSSYEFHCGRLGRTNDAADITYNFPGVPVDQLLDIYADLVGRTLLRSSSGPSAVPKDATIALKTQSPLTRSEAIVALETILGMNGITIVPIGEKFAKVVAEDQAGSEGGLISTNTNNLPEAGKMVTQIIQVKYTDIKDLSEVLKPFSRMKTALLRCPAPRLSSCGITPKTWIACWKWSKKLTC
jgi:hypothetical protein